MGGSGLGPSPVMRPPCQCTLLAQAPLAGKGILAREIPQRCTLRKQGAYPRTLSAKKHDDVHFIQVSQCFLAFPWPCPYTFVGLRKDPSFLRGNAPFSILHGSNAPFGGSHGPPGSLRRSLGLPGAPQGSPELPQAPRSSPGLPGAPWRSTGRPGAPRSSPEPLGTGPPREPWGPPGISLAHVQVILFDQRVAAT